MTNNIIFSFLSSFFKLFDARLNEHQIIGKKVFGNIVGNDDNERQDFSWVIDLEDTVLLKLKQLCDYLVRYDLADNDKILITESTLKTKLLELGWSISEAQENINYLCSIEVRMIDDGEETDSFFLHF